MKFVMGTKECMTQVYDRDGNAYAATLLRVTPMKVTGVKSVEKDGYEAVQVASGAQKEQRMTKAERGQRGGAYKHLKEFRPRASRGEAFGTFEKGSEIDVSVFVAGDMVTVSAVSKGKGFQGVVKRHGFAGDKASHGRKHSLRAPGSIGGGGRAGGRVAKGMRMAGRMGGERVTVKNLKVIEVNKERNMLVIAGAVPGRRGTLVEVRSA